MIKKYVLALSIAFFGCATENQIMKHPLDKSETRSFVLDSGLKVHLHSDPNFNLSAASMSVEVGSYEDPADREGLSHFLEHMLFLGTEKYPDVDEYSTYLKSNGGMSNAYTSRDHTNYQFQVLPDAFDGALDRFAQFFIGPLFTEEYTAREVNAVNSEYQKNVMSDGWRQFRMQGLFAKEGHPAAQFNIGNLETLGDIDRTELIDFYNKHYSANRMGLALLSTHSLDEMEAWARKHFSAVKNLNLERNVHDPNLVEDKKTLRLVHIEPVKDVRTMSVLFELPSTRDKYESKPGRQFGFILGHEGEGSLLSYLKQKGWALTLSAGARNESKEVGLATVSVGLTESGVKEYKNVLKAVIGYIELMKRSGYQSHVFEELQSMALLDEVYSSKGEGMWRATNLANEVMMYPVDDAGRVNYIYRDNSPDSYNDLLSSINIENMMVFLSSKNAPTNETEHFFEINYSYTEDDELYKELTSPVIEKEFMIPEENLFIPKNASVPKRELADDVFPRPLVDKAGVELYYGQDHEFLRPKGMVSLKVMFPKENMNIKHRVYSRIYVACVKESLNEISYPAKQAGLNYTIRDTYEGVLIDVNGYQESAMKLYETMLDHLVDYTITEDQFDAIKDKIVRDYQNFALSDAHQQTRELSSDVMFGLKYTWQDALPIAQDASLKDLRDYSDALYNKTFLEAMVYGDFKETDARKAVQLFNRKTNTKTVERDEVFDIEYLQLDQPETIQYTNNLKVNNSCFFRKYYIGEDSPQVRAAATIISQALQQPFYTEMRTNQQLGYIVWSYVRNMDRDYYLNFLIQSGVYPADELDARASAFLETAPKILEEMDQETFQQLIDSAIEGLEKKPMSISERAGKLKTLIFEYEADFARDEKTITALRSLKKESLIVDLEKILSKDSRKMVNVLSFAENHENKTGVKNSFGDLSDWKSSRVYE